MTQLTAMQKSVLIGIYRSDYADGERPSIWSWSIKVNSEVVKPKSIPGVVSSLAKRGFTSSWDSGDGLCVTVTEAGEKVARELPELAEHFAHIDTWRAEQAAKEAK